MNFGAIMEKLIEILNKTRDWFLGFWLKTMDFIKSLMPKEPKPISKTKTVIKDEENDDNKKKQFLQIKEWFIKKFGPGSKITGKRGIVIFALGGFGLLLIILLVSLVALYSGSRDGTNMNMGSSQGIAQEELFLPAEPDYLPQFLLEREPRRYWSLEDIRPFWKNPSESGQWREEIKSIVDNLMEGVP